MSQAYVEAAVDAGFDVFSLCNITPMTRAWTELKKP
jgi:hypothetical protein